MTSTQTAENRAPASALVTVVVLCFGGMSAALMQTLMIPIQTDLPRLLHTSPANASWVITATLLGGAVAMPIAGRLADMFGKQRVLVGSSVLLLVGVAGLRALRLAAPDAGRPRAAGPGHGLHPGRHLADARGHPAAHDRHRDRVDERDPRCRRRDRPAAVGLDRRGLRLARALLDVRRAGP